MRSGKGTRLRATEYSGISFILCHFNLLIIGLQSIVLFPESGVSMDAFFDLTPG